MLRRQHLGISLPQTVARNRRDLGAILAICVLATLFVAAMPALASGPIDNGASGASSIGPIGSGLQGAVPASPLILSSAKGTFAPEPADMPLRIRLGAGYELDPSVPDMDQPVPADLRAAPPSGRARGTFIVQFQGPITQAERSLIESLGGRIYGYVPDYAFLVSLTGDAAVRVASSSRVVWTGLYQPAYKISTEREMRESGRKEMILLLFPDASIEEASAEARASGATVLETYDNGINRMIRAEIDMATLPAIARIGGVAWIEPRKIPQLHNDRCQWVVQTWSSNNRRVWDMGIKGDGQIIANCDSGIRMTHKMFYDAAVPITAFGDFPTHRKVIAYVKSVEGNTVTFGDDAGNVYHGTHTNCTMAGDDAPNTADAHDGMAIHAKIYFQDGGSAFGAGIYVPPDLNDLLIRPYTGNAAGSARVMSNSWGNSNGGVYDVMSMTADQFMWSHPDFLPFFSNGNDGTTNSVGSPATAKNCVSAGGTGDGNSANQIYGSTSRGPTDDGRQKPTICAPAVLTSAYGQSDTGYTQLAGTSMASPAMAGATVLLRQYLTDGWYPTGAPVMGNRVTAPSAAVMKAMAINSADPDVSGYTVPDNNIGWGRIDDDQVLYFTGDARRLVLVDNTDGLLTGEYIEYQIYVANNVLPLKAALVWTDYPGNPNAAVELVNDLNLTATDGTNTYKGNVYSGGQSATGGAADNRNVEECVRRNAPTVGLWTFRVEAANVPFGPQPFALVITGGLAADQAVVLLDRATYGGSDDLQVRIIDGDAAGPLTVTAASTTEPSTESITLTGSNGVFQGSLPLRTTYPMSNNGVLSVSNGDQITVTYNDASPVGTLIAQARVDLDGPTITNVHLQASNEIDATIDWTTDATATSKVYYGTTPALGAATTLDPSLVVAHTVTVGGLLPDQTYYYDVESSDHQGNTVRDDNGGNHYTFTTSRNRDVLLVIGDSSFDKTQRYLDAFARTGWSYTLWQGNQADVPFAGNKQVGMASFKAILWQPGLEQYPMITDAARDSIARLMSLGSRFAIYSHDVAWDFSDTGSPDYTVARKDWFNTQLHATWQSDPTTFTTITGYASDPISGSYTGGVSYTPHRDGGAGDEIDGIAGAGTFAYDWRNNDTSADDIALRWTGNSPVGNPANSVWGGTPNKVSGNFFEWAHMNSGTEDDVTRADILDKTLIWLIGRDHPVADLTAPNGGETFTGTTVNVTWTESAAPGYSIAARKIYYSDNGGDSWTLITASAGPSPYSWNIGAIPNGTQYRIRVVVEDSGSPILSGGDNSAANFTINRAGGDTRGPAVIAGSIAINPDPVKVPLPITLTASITDVTTGNSNITAAEWSHGDTPAPAGGGTSMGGTFGSPTAAVTAAIDSSILTPGTDTVWVRGLDAAGNWGNATQLAIIVNTEPTDVADGAMPTRYALHAAAPNPFNPRTSIRFDLPRAGAVRLAVYDVSGRRVRTLADGPMAAGVRTVTWDGKDDGGHDVASGIYLYRLEAGAFDQTRKMVLLK